MTHVCFICQFHELEEKGSTTCWSDLMCCVSTRRNGRLLIKIACSLFQNPSKRSTICISCHDMNVLCMPWFFSSLITITEATQTNL